MTTRLDAEARRQKRKEYLAKWREKNREKLRLYQGERRRSLGMRPLEWRHGTRYGYNRKGCRCESCRSAERAYRQGHRLVNPGPERERQRRHRLSGKKAQNTRDYRARKAGNGGYATSAQVAARVAYFGNKCWVCGGQWDSIDHVIPVSRGGANWPANLRPACRSCNAAKGNRRVA